MFIRWRVASPARGAVSTAGLHGYPNGVVSVGEPSVADYEPEVLPSIASEDVEPRRWHALVAPGRAALDAFDWPVFAFALPAPTAVTGSAASARRFMPGASLDASAFDRLAGGALADRLARVRVLMRVIHRYSLFDAAPPAAARKGAR